MFYIYSLMFMHAVCCVVGGISLCAPPLYTSSVV